MDTITQIALGTTIAEAFFRQKLGKRALLFGAFCGWFPDIDVFFHPTGSWEGLAAHRGITHSLLCLPLFAPMLGEIGFRYGKKGNRSTWIHLAFWSLITHPLLDVCTSYGTQLFAPLSNHRYSTDAIAIIDLFYSIPLLYACYLSISRASNRSRARTIAQLALGISSLYLGLCHVISSICLSKAESLFTKQGFSVQSIRVNPPMFLPLLRRAVARNSQGDLITAPFSVISSEIPELYLQRRVSDPLITTVLNSNEGKIFQWFADDFIVVQNDGTSITLLDARYGLYQNPWWSPFSATATITEGEVSSLRRVGRPQNTDYKKELQLGWQVMWGK